MTKTINGLTVTTSAASGDFLAIWRASNADTRKITKANFMGGVLTGAGTIATGGFTLTVPATGTASLLGTAQTYSALKTFSAGIAFANETLSTYNEGTWTPAITASTSNPTITYTSQVGQYLQIGKLVFANFSIVINTYSGGSGNIRVSLPVAVSASFSANGAVALTGVDTPASTVGLVFVPTFNQSYGDIRATIDNASPTILDTTLFAAGDSLRGTAVYMTD